MADPGAAGQRRREADSGCAVKETEPRHNNCFVLAASIRAPAFASYTGIILIRKPIVVSFGRQHRGACNRAREHARCQLALESAWSPKAQEPPRGVHWRPSRLSLSLLFRVKMSVND